LSLVMFCFYFSSRRRHTSFSRDWSSDVCSSDLLCLAGFVAMQGLPVEQYPTITPVQVTVSATYPGADSKTLADAVAAPIEAQIKIGRASCRGRRYRGHYGPHCRQEDRRGVCRLR